MSWPFGLAVILLALALPLLLHWRARPGHPVPDRHRHDANAESAAVQLERRLAQIEGELDDLRDALERMRDELETLQRTVEDWQAGQHGTAGGGAS